MPNVCKNLKFFRVWGECLVLPCGWNCRELWERRTQGKKTSNDLKNRSERGRLLSLPKALDLTIHLNMGVKDLVHPKIRAAISADRAVDGWILTGYMSIRCGFKGFRKKIQTCPTTRGILRFLFGFARWSKSLQLHLDRNLSCAKWVDPVYPNGLINFLPTCPGLSVGAKHPFHRTGGRSFTSSFFQTKGAGSSLRLRKPRGFWVLMKNVQ